MEILEAKTEHLDQWVDLRYALWGFDPEDLREEAEAILKSQFETAFLMRLPNGEAIGFIEISLRQEGEKPHGYIEGWYVAEKYRGQGYGEELMDKAEDWILHHSIDLVLSDTIPETWPLSTPAHLKNGYEVWMDIRIFLKKKIGDREK